MSGCVFRRGVHGETVERRLQVQVHGMLRTHEIREEADMHNRSVLVGY